MRQKNWISRLKLTNQIVYSFKRVTFKLLQNHTSLYYYILILGELKFYNQTYKYTNYLVNKYIELNFDHAKLGYIH